MHWNQLVSRMYSFHASITPSRADLHAHMRRKKKIQPISTGGTNEVLAGLRLWEHTDECLQGESLFRCLVVPFMGTRLHLGSMQDMPWGKVGHRSVSVLLFFCWQLAECTYVESWFTQEIYGGNWVCAPVTVLLGCSSLTQQTAMIHPWNALGSGSKYPYAQLRYSCVLYGLKV